jgi:hypothetical protein
MSATKALEAEERPKPTEQHGDRAWFGNGRHVTGAQDHGSADLDRAAIKPNDGVLHQDARIHTARDRSKRLCIGTLDAAPEERCNPSNQIVRSLEANCFPYQPEDGLPGSDGANLGFHGLDGHTSIEGVVLKGEFATFQGNGALVRAM